MIRLGTLAVVIAAIAWWYSGYKSWERIIRKSGDFTLLHGLIGLIFGWAGPILSLFLVKDASDVVLAEQLPKKEDEAKQDTATDKNEKGFTLVELLIVVAILGTLFGAAWPELQKYIDKKRSAPAAQQQIEETIEATDTNEANPLN